MPISRSTGTTSRTTNGSETNIVASTIPGTANRMFNAVVREAAEPAAAPVEQHEREADDHRRERERQVDDGVQQPAPGEAAAHERERQDRSPKIVFAGTAIAAISSVSQSAWMRLRRRDGVPGVGEAVLEGAVEDEPDRHQQQDSAR